MRHEERLCDRGTSKDDNRPVLRDKQEARWESGPGKDVCQEVGRVGGEAEESS